MTEDNIWEIGVEDNQRLYIKPDKERFTLIYRIATEVHWDNNGLFLYSPKPREWTYFDWYKNIIGVIETEFNCRLSLTDQTKWINIPVELKKLIIGQKRDNYDGTE